MKRALNRIYNRHRWVPVVLTVVVMIPIGWLLSYAEMLPLAVIMGGFYLLASLLMGSVASTRLLKPHIDALENQCDPYPLLEECADQLTYVKNRSDRTALTLNLCAAQIEIGQHAQALTTLERLNIDDPVVTPMARFAYYTALTEAAVLCGQPEKAEVYYQKTAQQMDSLKGKFRKTADSSIQALTAGMMVMRGEYQQAAARLASVSLDTRHQQVNHAFATARIQVGLGNPAEARAYLEFVVHNGNRLHIVQRAQDMLNDMGASHEVSCDGK